MPNPHGGPNRGQGRKPKPLEAKYRHRMITLPPALDNRLIEWSIKTGREISPMIAELLTEYFENIGEGMAVPLIELNRSVS